MGKIKKFLKKAKNKVKNSVNNTTKKVKKKAKKTAKKVGKVVKDPKGSVENMGDKVSNTVNKVGDKVIKTGNKVGKTVKNPKQTFNNIENRVSTTFKNVKTKVKESDLHVGVKVNKKGIVVPKISISNSGTGKLANLNKKVGLRGNFKRLLVKKDNKWIELLHKRLHVNSRHDIRENIYYVNGIATDRKKGGKNKKWIDNYFDIDCKLIFNPTLGPVNKSFFVQAPFDLPEAKKDYDWFLSTAEGKYLEEINNLDFKKLDFSWFFTSKTNKIFRKPIENSITIATIALLFQGKSKNAPLGLIGSSQGSLIIFNALIAFSKLGDDNKRYLKNKVKAVFIGSVVPKARDIFLKRLIKKFDAHVDIDDPVAGIVSLKTKLSKIKNDNVKYHSVNWYLPHKENFNQKLYPKVDNFEVVKKRYKATGDVIRIEKYVPYNFFTQ